MSQNITVRCRRWAPPVGSAVTSGRPQPPQKRIPDGLSSPHCSQVGDIPAHMIANDEARGCQNDTFTPR